MKKLQGKTHCYHCGDFEWFVYFPEKHGDCIVGHLNNLIKNVINIDKTEQNYIITTHCPSCDEKYIETISFDEN